MKTCDGLISVSSKYVDDLTSRYPRLQSRPSSIVTFGASSCDFDLVKQSASHFPVAFKRRGGDSLDIVYVGVSGVFMRKSLSLIFSSFRRGLSRDHDFYSRFKMHFIGTSYAPKGTGIQSVLPVAEEERIHDYVTETTDRITFYE